MMTRDELKEYNKNRKIFQIGIIVPDMDEALKKWVEIYKVGPWVVYDHGNDVFTHIDVVEKACKKEFRFRCALAMVGDTQIELIQPIYGMPIFEDFLARTGGGLHHIKEIVTDEQMEEQLQDYAERGMPNVYGAHFSDATFYFPDTEEALGINIELGNGKNAKLPEDYPRRSFYPEK